MQQLYFVRKGVLEWREVNTPKLASDAGAIVRPFAVAKCDLDDAFLFNNIPLKLKLGKFFRQVDPQYDKILGNLFNGPFPFGHECVAEVTDIGDSVKKIKVGDVVSVPFQISCGTCLSCRLGYTSVCDNVGSLSTYGFGKHLGFGGAMSDFLNVPYADAMLTKIPTSIDPVHLASLSDNIPDAYRHVESLEKNNDQNILIIGGKAKSVGLYTLVLAKALGATSIDYVDSDEERLVIAKKSGANQTMDDLSQIAKRYDLVVDASSTRRGLVAALKAVRNFGVVTSSGIYLQKTPISLLEMYAKGVTFKTGLVNARLYTEKILHLVKNNLVDFATVTTKVADWDNAVQAFLSCTTKVIVARDRASGDN